MTDISNHHDLINPLGARIGSGIIKQLKSDSRYLIFIFGVLILWFIGVQIIYSLIEGSGMTTQNRAGSFVSKMIVRAASLILLLMSLRVIQYTRRIGDASLIVSLNQAVKNDPSKPFRWALYAIIAMVSYTFIMTNFMSVKTAIPEMIPFYMDETAQKWDRFLFFGKDPWLYFSWFYERPILVELISVIYGFWISIFAFIWIYCFTTEVMPRKRRFQFIISMMLLYIIAGNIMATFLSSAGPCYYNYFLGSDIYQPLMAKLHAIHEIYPLGSVKYQDALLMMYENKETRFAGISAMPSLHCSTSLLFLCLFWKNKILRALLIAFNITIYIGSIVLAWHYAVDGLIAYPIALFCWWVSGKMAATIENRSPVTSAQKP